MSTVSWSFAMVGAVRFLETLRVLARHEVEFVIVGGVAAVLEGAPVMTFDLDVVYARSPQNNERLAGALRDLNARYKDLAGRRILPDTTKLSTVNVHLLDTDQGPLDLLYRVRGDLDYAAVLGRSVRYEVGGLVVNVLALESVIECKRFANRDKDRAVLPILLKTLDVKRARRAVD
jgi:hypothetical protein